MNTDLLNREQQLIYDDVMAGHNIFITGGAGTGKSFLLKVIMNTLKSNKKQVIICAPTGLAAASIGGTTIHQAFNFKSTAAFTPKKLKIVKRAPKTIQQADVIIIDEISMCRMDIFDAIYASLEKVQSITGKMPQVIVAGDFHQLPPVLSNDTGERELLEKYYKRPIKETYAFLSNSWNKFHFKCHDLAEIVRQNEIEFTNALNLARKGDTSCIPFFNMASSPTEISYAPKLYAYNEEVDKANLEELVKLPDTETVFETICEGMNVGMEEQELPKQLHLKPGCRVVITSNDAKGKYAENLDLIDPNANWIHKKERLNQDMYHNGSLGTVLSLYQDPADYSHDYVVIRLDSGANIILYRQDYDVIQYKIDVDTETIYSEILGTYYQFPLRLAYALTIHKGQGQTYDCANIEPFCKNPGQLYVALSRVKSIKNMHLYHEITPEYLFTSPLVEEFYEHMHEESCHYSWMIQENEASPEERTTNNEETIVRANKKTSEKTITQSKVKKEYSASNKKGRPARYPSGSKVIRIPNEIDDAMYEVLEHICPKTGMNIEKLSRFQDLIDVFLSE